MFKCKDCNGKFIKPYEIGIDAGIHHDTGVIRRHKVPSMLFCPECRSRNYEEISEVA